MPPKTIVCEFCTVVEGKNVEHRKDTLATHVRSKHIKELSKWLLEDSIESRVNTITGYACDREYNPIYSKRYEGATYIFGVSPRFFEDNKKDDEELSKYIKCEDNLKSHNEFVGELMGHIPMVEYFKHHTEIVVTCREVTDLKKSFRQATAENKRLQEELDHKNKYCKKIEEDNEEYQSYYDSKEVVTKIIADNKCMERRITTYQQSIEDLRKNLTQTEEMQQDLITEINMRNHKELEYYISQLDECKANCKKLTETNEKYMTKIKTEAENLYLKYKKDKKKKKKQKKKEKMIAKMKEKMKEKLEEKLNNSSDSDSDSDSD